MQIFSGCQEASKGMGQTMGEDTDLKQYWRLVVKRGTMIRDAVIIAIVIALVPAVILPMGSRPAYKASSYLAVLRSRSQVDFDSKIKTVTQDVGGAAGSPVILFNPQTRINSLIKLVPSPQIATGVRAQLRLQAPVESLAGMIEGRQVSGTELIEIIATSPDPGLSAALTNAWVAEYSKFVNRIFGEASTDVSALETQLEVARGRLQEAQSKLVDFTRNSQIEALQQRVRLLGVAVSYLTASPTKDTLEIPPEFSIVPPELRIIRELASFYQQKIKLQALHRDAISLQAQLDNGGDPEAVSSEIAVLILKTKAFSPGDAPGNLQIDFSRSSNNPSRLMSDVRSMIAAVQDRISELDGRIQANSRALLPAGSSPAARPEELIKQVVQNLNTEINALQADLLAADARRTSLAKDRELAWNTHTALAQKLEEQKAGRAFSGQEVQVVSTATAAVPFEPLPLLERARIILMAVAIAAVVGLMGAFIMESVAPDVASPSLLRVLRPRRDAE